MEPSVTYDLSVRNPQEVYLEAVATMKYCQEVIDSIKTRVFEGDILEGFKIVQGKKTRSLTKEGLNFAISQIGEEKMYEKKPIGITKLEKLLDRQTISAMEASGLIEFKEGNPQIEVE